MNRTGKWLSWLLLLVTLSVLLVIGGKNLINKLNRRAVVLKETAFGVSADTKIVAGRDYSIKKNYEDIEPPIRQLLVQSEEYWIQGKQDQAITSLEEALKLDGKAIPVYERLTDFLQSVQGAGNAESKKKIIGLYRKALEIDPGHPLLRYKLGAFFWKTGELDRAAQEYEMASEASPAFALPHIGLGECLLKKEKYTQAAQEFKTAVSLMGGAPEAPYDLLAFTYYKLGQDDSAALVVEHAKHIGLNNSQVRFTEALLWEASGRLDAARKTYEKLMKQDGNEMYRWALATLGKKPSRAKLVEAVEIEERDWEEATSAIEILDPLVKLYHENAPLWFALGKAYLQRELFAHAVECFDSAMKYDPDIPLAMEQRKLALKGIELQGYYKQPKEAKIPEGTIRPLDKKDKIVLGHYYLHWGASKEEVFEAYPDIEFQELENGNLREVSFRDNQRNETLLGFKKGKLWGIRVFIIDTTRGPEDLFGELIGLNSQISGKGKATGSASCAGFKPFQGIVWENEDTVEIMAQFKGKEWQIRLARTGRESLTTGYKLCDMLALLDTDTWK
ncbi:tetratricopeptide repeat protein [Fibrobacterota bacterium]